MEVDERYTVEVVGVVHTLRGGQVVVVLIGFQSCKQQQQQWMLKIMSLVILGGGGGGGKGNQPSSLKTFHQVYLINIPVPLN